MDKNKYWIIGLIVLLSMLAVSPVVAQDTTPPTADEINEIAKNMFCPVCENIPLDVCPTAACAQWRQQISDMLADGKTETEIYDFFALSYGDRVLAEPPKTGLNWLIYIVPPLAFVIFAVGLFGYINNRQTPAEEFLKSQVSEITNKDENYQSRFEEELKKRL